MDPVALRYATCAWNLKFAREQEHFFGGFSAEVVKLINLFYDEGYLDDAELEAVEEWKSLLYSQRDRFADLMSIAEEDAEIAERQYQTQRLRKGLPVFEARYFICPFTPLSRLRIQKHYDIRREALHIDSSTITAADFNAFRSEQGGRTYYTGSALITPDLLPAAEIVESKAIGDEIYRTRSFFPREIAEIVNIRQDMLPKNIALRRKDWVESIEPRIRARDVEEKFDMSPNAVEKRALARSQWIENEDCVLDTTPEEDLRQAEVIFNIRDLDLNSQVQQHSPSPVLPAAVPVPLQQQPAQLPALSRHGRPLPYKPTLQPDKINKKQTRNYKTRGLAPPGVDDETWRKAYDAAEFSVYSRTIGSTEEKIKARKEARECGETRDITIDRLIEKGLLAVGFRDLSP